jgi:glyoxylase-like metal-dependent hydrolase (beta-lactamase superfamily II)
MRIGSYTLRQIETGRFSLDGGAMFGIVPRTLWERQIEPDARHRIPLAMRCLLLEGEGRLVLVDNGVGDKSDERFTGLYGLDFEHSELHRSLRAVGFSAEDVTDVVLTHLHFDHCGGSTTREGDRLRPTFPNATYHVQDRHWRWAQESPREQASFLRENLEPLSASGRLNRVDGPGELFPGVELIVVDGHTRGQQLVRVHGPEGSLLFAADLLPTAAHVPLLWIMAYDVAPLETLAEKERLLARAAEEDWWVMFEHDVRTALAHVRHGEKGYAAVDALPDLAAAG